MSVDSLLTQITESLKATIASVDNLSEFAETVGDVSLAPEFIQELIKAENKGAQNGASAKLEGVSLLALKNHSLLSYLNNLALILSARLDYLTNEDKELEKVKEIRDKAIAGTIMDRVVLDRGVKSLEKKLTYQLDKLVSSYQRREKEVQEAGEDKKHSHDNSDEEGEEEGEEEDDEEDSEEEDGLSYRPDASRLLKQSASQSTSKATKNSSQYSEDEDEDEEEDDDDEEEGGKPSKEKYRPPKISAMLPPQAPSRSADAEETKSRRVRNLQSMDEYLQDISDAPRVEHSIGSTILEHGRGGMKTDKDRAKEAEITKYEEENFTRLPQTQTKVSFKEKMKKRNNEFFGEDWSMFNNTGRDYGDSASRSKNVKRASAWDRAKSKRRRN